MTTTKNQALALINDWTARFGTRDADVNVLLTDARNAYRQARYDAVARTLTQANLDYQRSLA